jgi:hypothetical protein
MNRITPLLLAASLFGFAAFPGQAAPSEGMMRVRFQPAQATTNDTTFRVVDDVGGLTLAGTGTVVADTDGSDGKAFDFTSSVDGSARSQPAIADPALRVEGNIAVRFRVKPEAGNREGNGGSIIYLQGVLEIRYRPERKGYSLYVWIEDKTAVQLFVPAAEGRWSEVEASIIGDAVKFTVDGNTVTGTARPQPKNARVIVASADTRPFFGRIGTIVISEPSQ